MGLMVCEGTFLSLLSPHLFHSFDVLNPTVNGQGQAWIAPVAYYTPPQGKNRGGRGHVDLNTNI